MEDFFVRMSIAKSHIEEFLKDFYFEKNNEETRQKITTYIKECLAKHELGPWDIEFRDGLGFTVALKTDLEIDFFVRGN